MESSKDNKFYSFDLKSSKSYSDSVSSNETELGINVGEITIVVLEENMDLIYGDKLQEEACVSGGCINTSAYFKLIPNVFSVICDKGVVQSSKDIEHLLPINHFL